jgi:hypothetical protein
MRVNRFFRFREEREILKSEGGEWLKLCGLDVIPYGLVDMYQRFGGTWYIHLQGTEQVS